MSLCLGPQGFGLLLTQSDTLTMASSEITPNCSTTQQSGQAVVLVLLL